MKGISYHRHNNGRTQRLLCGRLILCIDELHIKDKIKTDYVDWGVC